jgi:hypothetical protein
MRGLTYKQNDRGKKSSRGVVCNGFLALDCSKSANVAQTSAATVPARQHVEEDETGKHGCDGDLQNEFESVNAKEEDITDQLSLSK